MTLEEQIEMEQEAARNRKVEFTWTNYGALWYHKSVGEHVFTKDKTLAKVLKIPYEPETAADFVPPDDINAEVRSARHEKARKTGLAGDEHFNHRDGTVAQFMRLYGYNSELSNYRRYKLKRFFEKELGDKYNGITDIRNMETGHYKYMVISNSVGWRTMIDTFSWDYLIYDRTDNWGDWSQENRKEEDELIAKADIVFNSSRWLYEDSKKKRDGLTILVPNGCDVKEYVPQEKYKEPTGCYAGKTDNKVDWDLVKKLADNYKIKIFGAIEPQFEHDNVEWCGFFPEDKLQHEMAKCHFGIIPFKPGDWTAAMLPLKIFHYANSHIPTVYSNCPECSYYPTIASEITMGRVDILEPTEEEYEEILKEADWQHKFEFMWKTMQELTENNDDKDGRHNAGGETEGHVSNQLEDD